MLFEIEVFKIFILAMARFSGLLITAPVLGSRNFPVIAKAGLAALSAMVVLPSISALAEPLPSDFLHYAIMGAGETLIGMMMGFVMTLVFAAIQIAGQIIDMQSGFALINVFNPALESQVPVFGFFLFLVAALLLLAVDGHHLMIRYLAATFDSIPPGNFVVRPELLREVSSWGRVMFVDGLVIAAPVAASLTLAYVVLGILSRVVPQIHLFVVGFPMTIALSLVMVALFMPLYVGLVQGLFHSMFKDTETLIRMLANSTA